MQPGRNSLQNDSTIPEQRFLIVADSRDDYIPGLLRQLGISLRYSRLLVETFDLSVAGSLPDLSRYSSVLFLSAATREFFNRSLDELRGYVQRGGGLTFLSPPLFTAVQKLLGIVSATSFEWPPVEGDALDDDVHTIHFTGDRFRGLQGTSVSFHDVRNRSPLELTLHEDVIVDAYFDFSRPAIWHRSVGAGEIGVWAFVPMGRHWGRALLIHSVIQSQMIGVKSIANTAMFQIDDFPAPSSGCPVPVESGVYLDWKEFVDRVWLPDMLELASMFQVVYSCGLIFNFNDRTAPPFIFDEWSNSSEVRDGKRIDYPMHHACRVAGSAEIGLHGYNHVPLTLDNWSSRNNMVESLRAGIARWQADSITSLPTSYIPPMNVYDKDGALALTEACPTIRAVCGNFWGPISEGGGREFTTEQWNPKLFCLPRVTSGYELDSSGRWKIVSSIYELGAWTHFVHPDDILDVPVDDESVAYSRNPKSRPWLGADGLRKELESVLHFARTTFPWLTFRSATDSMTTVVEHLDNAFRCRIDDQRVVLDTDRGSHVVMFVRDPGKKIANIDNLAEILDVSRTAENTSYTIRIMPGRTTVKFQN